MGFSSLEFIFRFLIIFLLVYYVAPRKYKNLILLIGSLIFYAFGEQMYFLLLVASVLINYLIAIKIEKSPKSKEWLVFAIVFDVGILFVAKYLNFFIDNINMVVPGQLPEVSIDHLPLGISFYTFQVIAYMVDVYRKKIHAERKLVPFATFITMFPQLIQGPIVYYSEVKQDLRRRRVRPKDIEAGTVAFVIGLSYKVILADKIYTMWNSIMTAGAMGVTTPVAWLGAWACSFYIYFDFVGYSMMAVGLGRLMGFYIPMNFADPYESKTATEFWRRWHITLGRWFKDYIYIPLGGNRKGKARMIFNLFVVWALTGLWHGANWNFIIWGLGFFVLIMIEKMLTYKYLNKSKIVGHIYMLIVIPVSWIIFSLSNFSDMLAYLKRMFFIPMENAVQLDGMQLLTKYLSDYWWLLILCAIASTGIPMKLIDKFYDTKVMKVIFAVLFWICVYFMLKSGSNPFLYLSF